LTCSRCLTEAIQDSTLPVSRNACHGPETFIAPLQLSKRTNKRWSTHNQPSTLQLIIIIIIVVVIIIIITIIIITIHLIRQIHQIYPDSGLLRHTTANIHSFRLG
jgi:heme/copper-type cytochrome/quinol oxidase subunit 2